MIALLYALLISFFHVDFIISCFNDFFRREFEEEEESAKVRVRARNREVHDISSVINRTTETNNMDKNDLVSSSQHVSGMERLLKFIPPEDDSSASNGTAGEEVDINGLSRDGIAGMNRHFLSGSVRSSARSESQPTSTPAIAALATPLEGKKKQFSSSSVSNAAVRNSDDSWLSARSEIANNARIKKDSKGLGSSNDISEIDKRIQALQAYLDNARYADNMPLTSTF